MTLTPCPFEIEGDDESRLPYKLGELQVGLFSHGYNRKRFQGIKELEAHLEKALSGIGPVSIPNLSAAISVAEYQSLSQLSKVLPRPITS